MFIVIDSKTKQFLPIAHTQLDVVGDLVWLEARDHPVHIENAEWPFLTTWSDLEMMMLFKNTTGKNASYLGDNLRALLLDLARQVAERNINVMLLSNEAGKVSDTDKGRYLYVAYGDKHRVEKFEGYTKAVGIALTASENEVVSRPRVRPVARELPPAQPYAAGERGERPVRAPSGPRQHGVRDLIWGVADKMWEAAGSPKDPAIVLKLRRDMMAALEAEHGVKRTSSSNELGNWMKNRI